MDARLLRRASRRRDLAENERVELGMDAMPSPQPTAGRTMPPARRGLPCPCLRRLIAWWRERKIRKVLQGT